MQIEDTRTVTFEQRPEGSKVKWISGEEYSRQRTERGQRPCGGRVVGMSTRQQREREECMKSQDGRGAGERLIV